MAGVDAAQQRLDQAVEHVATQALGDERGDRHVLVGHGQDAGLGHVGDAGRGERGRVGRDAHDGRRHGPQRTVRPDRRRDGLGVHDPLVQTHRVDEVERLPRFDPASIPAQSALNVFWRLSGLCLVLLGIVVAGRRGLRRP